MRHRLINLMLMKLSAFITAISYRTSAILMKRYLKPCKMFLTFKLLCKRVLLRVPYPKGKKLDPLYNIRDFFWLDIDNGNRQTLKIFTENFVIVLCSL